jgi:predicted DNA-binding transcriptional regulator AlpA
LLLSARKLAEMLDISTATLWRLRSAGKLPRPLRLGSSLRWRAEEVRQWVETGMPDLMRWESLKTAGGAASVETAPAK